MYFAVVTTCCILLSVYSHDGSLYKVVSMFSVVATGAGVWLLH